jgi:LmbE family N-acetylglucosaminyl deacetylase
VTELTEQTEPTERLALTPLDETTFETVLCVVAHPDDLEYGTAAAVHKWVRAGKTVTYLLVTRGEAGIDTTPPAQAGPLREAEEREGASRVGVEVVEFLDGFADGVVEHGLPLRRAIAREIRIRRPDLVVAQTYADHFPGGFVNQSDHRAVGLATIDAKADAGNRWIFPDLVDEGHEPWQVAQVFVTSDPDPTHFVDASEHFEAAVASLEAHDAYLAALGPDYPKPRDLLQMILSGPSEITGATYSVTGRLIG